jgi:hypothetical protein
MAGALSVGLAAQGTGPDPNRTVYRGRMTWEEIMSPFFSVITDAKTDPKTILKLRGQTRIDNGPEHSRPRLRAA